MNPKTSIVASYDPYDLSMENQDLFAAIDKAKCDGFSFFDLLIPKNKVKEYIKCIEVFKQRDVVYSIHADYKINLASNEQKERKKTITYFQDLILFASAINASPITVHLSTRLNNDQDRERCRMNALENMKKIMDLAQMYNINLAIENLEGNRIGESEEDLDFFFKNIPQLKMTLDVAHALIQRQNPQEFYEKFKERVKFIHISGISSVKQHYKTPLDESEVDLKPIIEWITELEIPIKIENIYYNDFLQSCAVFINSEQRKKESCKLSQRVNAIKSSLIKEMSKKREGVISLAQGVPQIEIREEIKDAIRKIQEKENEKVFKYTEQAGLYELRELIAQRLEEQLKKNIDVEEVIITAGAISGLFCTLSSILDEDDEVILFTPTYASYIEQILLLKAKPVFVELSKNEWNINPTKIREAITERTKCIIVCSPSNPTGTLLNEEELKQIAEIAKENNMFVIADNTYEDLVYDYKKTSTATLPKIANEQYIGISSFSKNIPLSGLRIGYVYANKEIIKGITKVNDAFSICAPSLSQYIIFELLRNKSEKACIISTRNTLKKRRDLICERLDNLTEYFTYKRPEGALYVFVKLLKTNDDTQFCKELLEEAKVSVVPGSCFGPNGEGFVRMSFGATEEVINEAFDRIEAFLKINLK